MWVFCDKSEFWLLLTIVALLATCWKFAQHRNVVHALNLVRSESRDAAGEEGGCDALSDSCFLLFLPSLQTVPKPIALEPCFGNKAAVLSVFVRLPRGLGGIPPPGQSGEEYWLGINSLLLPQPHSHLTLSDLIPYPVSTQWPRMRSGYFRLANSGPAGFWPGVWINFLGQLMDYWIGQLMDIRITI